MIKAFIKLSFLFILVSCTKGELPNYDNATFLEMGRAGDPDLKIILPGSIVV